MRADEPRASGDECAHEPILLETALFASPNRARRCRVRAGLTCQHRPHLDVVTDGASPSSIGPAGPQARYRLADNREAERAGPSRDRIRLRAGIRRASRKRPRTRGANRRRRRACGDDVRPGAALPGHSNLPAQDRRDGGPRGTRLRPRVRGRRTGGWLARFPSITSGAYPAARSASPAAACDQAVASAAGLEDAPQALDRARDETVVRPRPPSLGLDETGVAKDPQVVGDGRLRERERLGEVADAALLAGREAVDDRHARRGRRAP